MEKTLLSWTVRHGGTKTSPKWGDIFNMLILLRFSSGNVTLYKLDSEGYLIFSLQVSADKGFYFVKYLNENDEILTLSTGLSGNHQIEILGDYLPANQLTSDFNFVVVVFEQFFNRGTVSPDFLSGIQRML